MIKGIKRLINFILSTTVFNIYVIVMVQLFKNNCSYLIDFICLKRIRNIIINN